MEPVQPATCSNPPACLQSALQQPWLLGSRRGSRPASLRVPPSARATVSPGCLPWTHADSAGPAPGWCQLQGKYWSRQLSTGLPLEQAWEGRRRNHVQGPAQPPAQQPTFTCWRRPPSPCLCFSRLLSRSSHGCHTKSALWGSAAARARSLIEGISAWNREPTLIRLQGWKGQGVRSHLVGMGSVSLWDGGRCGVVGRR